MNKNSLKIFISSIGVAIILAFMATATYAYFTLEIEGEGKDISLKTFNKNMEITYTDTSNVTLVNAYTGDMISKTFTVKNTGDVDVYYNVTFEDVVNNFEKPEELVYNITETGGSAYRDDSALPTSDSTILSDIKIPVGETHYYVLIIKFLDKGIDQTYNMNKTFSTNINIVPSEKSSTLMTLKNNSLTYKIMNSNSKLYKVTDTSDSTSNDVSLYYTNNSTNGTSIYFYKDDNTVNNNVLFGGYCWKVIRTTENAGVKMIYNGVSTNGACNNTSETSTIGTSVFNTNSNYNAYVGYMYGEPNSTSYIDEHKNTNNSTIKTMLENWYANNLLKYNDYIEDTNYCNDRSMIDVTIDNVVYSKNGYGNLNTGYHILSDNMKNYQCQNTNDKFSVQSKTNTYPVGLITLNEVLMGKTSTTNENISYWTMTPAYFNGTSAYNFLVNNGNEQAVTVNTTSGVRPVIALKSSVTVISGNGSLESPYKITE